MPRIEKVSVSPSRLLDELERAASALERGNAPVARECLSYAVTRLQAVRLAQDLALDESVRTVEVPAQRVVPPQGGEAAEA